MVLGDLAYNFRGQTLSLLERLRRFLHFLSRPHRPSGLDGVVALLDDLAALLEYPGHHRRGHETVRIWGSDDVPKHLDSRADRALRVHPKVEAGKVGIPRAVVTRAVRTARATRACAVEAIGAGPGRAL